MSKDPRMEPKEETTEFTEKHQQALEKLFEAMMPGKSINQKLEIFDEATKIAGGEEELPEWDDVPDEKKKELRDKFIKKILAP